MRSAGALYITYGECGDAWYCPFASEEIWRTGSTPVFRDKGGFNEIVKVPQFNEEKAQPTIKGCADITKNFLGFNKFEGRIKIKLLL